MPEQQSLPLYGERDEFGLHATEKIGCGRRVDLVLDGDVRAVRLPILRGQPSGPTVRKRGAQPGQFGCFETEGGAATE